MASSADDIKDYRCFIGPDRTELMANKQFADGCAAGDTCECEQLKALCKIGPDSQGNFFEKQTSYKFAATCDREICSCSTHENYKPPQEPISGVEVGPKNDPAPLPGSTQPTDPPPLQPIIVLEN